MKQSLQDKAAFFAQYWGQKIRKWDGMPSYTGLVSSTYMTKYATNGCYLELIPISSITDEDAIEVAKMIFSNTALHTPDRGKWYVRVMIESKKEHHGLYWSFEKVCNTVDYLRSREYLLPFRQYTTQQLLDMGWAKIKTK